jgi:DNA-binding NtrC family response regulator
MKTKVLVIDDDREFVTFIRVSLKNECDVYCAYEFVNGIELIRKHSINLVLLDISLGSENGIGLIRKIKRLRPTIDVIMVTGHKDPALLLEAVREGASDYLVKPFAQEELFALIEKFSKRSDEQPNTIPSPHTPSDCDYIVGRSDALLYQLGKARKLKGEEANVIIEGESGTGKELFARFIHEQEEDPKRPFVAINCAAIPTELLESELFGHEKGSFTGATERKIGKFELAHQGDLFLDEVSTLHENLQAKILRAIESKLITRVGGGSPINVNFRVIAATNENLEQRVRDGQFRRDLYHRLHVVSLTIPPLRKRKEDIPLLVEAFLKKYGKGRAISCNQSAMIALSEYSWPGNVRELEHFIWNLSIIVPGNRITVSDLPECIFQKNTNEYYASLKVPSELELPESPRDFLSLKDYVRKAEKAYIERALSLMEGDRSKAAAILQVSRTRLYERLKSWGMR